MNHSTLDRSSKHTKQTYICVKSIALLQQLSQPLFLTVYTTVLIKHASCISFPVVFQKYSFSGGNIYRGWNTDNKYFYIKNMKLYFCSSKRLWFLKFVSTYMCVCVCPYTWWVCSLSHMWTKGLWESNTFTYGTHQNNDWSYLQGIGKWDVGRCSTSCCQVWRYDSALHSCASLRANTDLRMWHASHALKTGFQ